MTLDEIDATGLIREAYRIEGITPAGMPLDLSRLGADSCRRDRSRRRRSRELLDGYDDAGAGSSDDARSCGQGWQRPAAPDGAADGGRGRATDEIDVSTRGHSARH